MRGVSIQTHQKQYDKDLIRRIAVQCAPVLMGVKISNILIVNRNEEQEVKAIFNEHLLSYYPLFQCEKRAVFLVYHQTAMIKHMQQSEQRAFLRKMGYFSLQLEKIFSQLAVRYQIYMLKKEAFPHELGVLLGYPTKDVESFIDYKGQHYLGVGYWKVYHNLPQAVATFKSYDNAKVKIIEQIKLGYSLDEIASKVYSRADKMTEKAV